MNHTHVLSIQGEEVNPSSCQNRKETETNRKHHNTVKSTPIRSKDLKLKSLGLSTHTKQDTHPVLTYQTRMKTGLLIGNSATTHHHFYFHNQTQ